MIDVDYLKEIRFFNSLDKEIVSELLDSAKVKNFNAMDILFYEREDKDEIYYIVSGSLKFYKVDRFDNEIYLYKLDSHSLIFNVSKLCEQYMVSCYANSEFLEDSEVIIFDGQKFKEIMYKNREFMLLMLQESFMMIQKLQCIISRDVVFDGTAKVAHMLVNDLKTFNAMKKHEIAYMLHIQPETLSRILKKLARNETIEVDKNSIVVLNADELREIYE